ncbi:hypothetical protein [Usitatibacter palustris]|uniref:Lipoprotein n=1 Tax=Usitatibacter palustris TaxID=2732487 RepID=A0A6M4H9D1_9PROT|nr:hypothetical protein [Usitatibacter palustris]QJR15805.1 hypothetical protein DSM104440_02631 [Usitatibacter palustris]
MKGRFLAVAALALAAGPAAAECTWEWLCSGEGGCKQMPICKSVYDVPPPAPTAQPPAMPPLGMRPAKSPGPMGTLTCEHIMRQGKSGRWYWDEACFCTDPTKARDPSAPFANIVRCQAPKKE